MTQKSRTYEGMFLVDAGKSDFEAAAEPIRTILARSEAEILSIKPWDEKRLAYKIRGRKRALYVLTYFKADPASTSDIEQYCDLSEDILRVMILRHDNLTDEQINAKTPAETATARRPKPPPRPAADAKPSAEAKDDSPDKKAEPEKPQPKDEKDDSPDKKAEPEKPQPKDEPAPAAAADQQAKTEQAKTEQADTEPADQTSQEPQT